ncbi:MAG: DUF1329 domain-containing protein [Cycloclasticus sp.]|nr:DUF1329 domain-containing protein [Cycloclasticus sp.]
MKINKLFTYGISALVLASVSVQASAKVPQVGDVIDASNVSEYSDYLIEGNLEYIKDGQVLKVVPKSKEGSLSYPGFIEATKQNAGKARMLDEYGTVGLEDGSYWVGGLPFQEPKSGLEVMANYQYGHLALEGDNWGSRKGTTRPVSRIFSINKDGEVYKELKMAGGQMMMGGRVSMEPKPFVPGHEGELLRRYLTFVEPYDVQGIVTLDIQYQDQSKLPESYVYLPSFRRVRQVSTANRADSVAGTELTQSDLGGFSDPLGLWTYKILKKTEMLVPIKNAVPAVQEEAPKIYNGYFPEEQRLVELREAYVIEALPRFDTIYSKKVMLIDAEVFRITDVTIYDKQGKLFKSVLQDWALTDDNHPKSTWMMLHNFQTGGSSLFLNYGLDVNVEGISLDLFEKSAMKNFSR